MGLPPIDGRTDIELDMRLAWRPRSNLGLAVVAQSLLDSHHLEFGTNLKVVRIVTEDENRDDAGLDQDALVP